MNRKLALCTWGLVIATASTGLAQAWMRYVIEPSDPFSAYNHPWQGLTSALHAFLGPLLILTIGLVLAAHSYPKWRSPAPSRRVRLGGVLAAGLALAIIGTGAWLGAWPPVESKLLSWLHGIAGTLFALAFIGHALSAGRTAHANRQADGHHH